MKYNSIGEQLIAKAKELDPSYKPDKFNDMSEAINIILNNTDGDNEYIDLTPYLRFDVETANFYFINIDKRRELVEKIREKPFLNAGYMEIIYEGIVMEVATFKIFLTSDHINFCALNLSEFNGIVDKIGLDWWYNNYNENELSLIAKDNTFLLQTNIGSDYHQNEARIVTINDINLQENLTIGSGLEIKDGALQATSSGGGTGNVKIFQPTITNVSVSTRDNDKTIEISFDALNGVKPYILSLVDSDKNFSANLFLKTIISNNYQIRLISPLSLINDRSGDTIFVMGGRLIQDSTSKIDLRLTFNATGAYLYFYFDNNDIYTQFKQLASLLFTTDTILKLTIKTDE